MVITPITLCTKHAINKYLPMFLWMCVHLWETEVEGVENIFTRPLREESKNKMMVGQMSYACDFLNGF